MKTKLLKCLSLALIGLSPIHSFADTQMANQYLQRALNEMSAAKVYIQEANAQSPKGQRVEFHYNWLVSDINKIQGGIYQKFDKPRVQPRNIKPVTGDYLTIVGQGGSQ